MQLKKYLPKRTLSSIIIIVLIISSLLITQAYGLQLTTTPEYIHYVHTSSNTQGNYTYVEKPIFPITINNSQIQIGGNWTIICPLQAEHSYHVYCYGAWINVSSAAKTDYDISVLDPQGDLVGTHTEAAGLPEHLGTTVTDSFFTPIKTGNYSFVITNNPFDSGSAQQATFMIIENLQCDQWYTISMEGTEGNNSRNPNNCKAYEFVTNAQYVKLYVKVPQILDMYQARLYLMNDANSPSLNSCPLPWELGLYGNVSGVVGGYNFEGNGYTGVAYASCENMGQSMYLNYTSTNSGANLYHLVLLGEKGSGDVQLLLKTNFDDTPLTPLNIIGRVNPNNATEIAYASNNINLKTAQLKYSTDNWANTTTLNMDISNKTCRATIPGQKVGSSVQYQIQALDILENSLEVTDTYTVKETLALNITAVKEIIRLGENITINGVLTPNNKGQNVTVQFSSVNSTQIENCTTSNDGSFVASFKPDSVGQWAVSATSSETKTSWRSDGEQLMIKVNEPPIYVKYSMFIIIGLVVALAVGGAVYYLKFRNR
jgi:hypothetical protein